MTDAISLRNVSKVYRHYDSAWQRLRSIWSGKPGPNAHVALHPLDLNVRTGEVVGVIGLNGAGKSTLLKLLAGTLAPTTGTVHVQGHVAALLELGAGFHPDMTGRENVYMAAAVAGLSRQRIDALYGEIVEFAGIGSFMDEPVKTYSSGMFVRLAFSVATAVTPDILIIDEALSVGDGQFGRRSFDRIMEFRRAGKTILFCSHSLYQVEALCHRALWVHEGRLHMDGPAAEVVAAYNSFLGTPGSAPLAGEAVLGTAGSVDMLVTGAESADTRLISVTVNADGRGGDPLRLKSGVSTLTATICYVSSMRVPVPSVAVAIVGTASGRVVASAGTFNDGYRVSRDDQGYSEVRLSFPSLPLLKGQYELNVYLLCEQGIHVYVEADRVVEMLVEQEGLEQGVVSLPHAWQGDVESVS